MQFLLTLARENQVTLVCWLEIAGSDLRWGKGDCDETRTRYSLGLTDLKRKTSRHEHNWICTTYETDFRRRQTRDDVRPLADWRGICTVGDSPSPLSDDFAPTANTRYARHLGMLSADGRYRLAGSRRPWRLTIAGGESHPANG